MDARELLKDWPAWAKANAETILASPAWRMPVKYAGDETCLTRAADGSEPEGGEILLKISLGETQHVLGIRDAERYGDLHLLWARRTELDVNLLLALVERACGPLFQMLEDAVGREFSVSGVVGPEAATGRRAAFALPDATFSIDLSPELAVLFGNLDFLDPTHEAIRSQTRPARYRYEMLSVPGDDLAGMVPGDCVVMSGGEGGGWIVELPDDDRVHLCAPDEEQIPFLAFADDKLPRPADDDRLVMVKGGRIIADGEFSRIGDVRCFKLIHSHS